MYHGVKNYDMIGVYMTSNPIKKTRRPEVYMKLEAWVNKLGGDSSFAKRIGEVPRTVRELIESNPELMCRFGFKTPK